jgi:hypothetical protein
MRTVTVMFMTALMGACSGRASTNPAVVHAPTDEARTAPSAAIEAAAVAPSAANGVTDRGATATTSVDPAVRGADDGKRPDEADASGELRGYAIMAPRTPVKRRTRSKSAAELVPLGCPLTAPPASWYERYSRVKVDVIRVEGPLAAAVVGRLLAAQVRLVKQCHALVLADDAKAAGRVQVRLAADTDGGTSDVALLAADLKGLPFTTCLVEALREMKFPPTDADTRVVVEYTLSARSQPPKDPTCARLRQWLHFDASSSQSGVEEPRRDEPGP